jgi:transposase-like protein
LVALAVWPESGRQEILDWQLADGEDAHAWTTFLRHLEELGVRAENGLTLVIHDGGDGLRKALQMVRLGAPQQRCLFHKLRNIASAIQVPLDLSRKERTRLRTTILKDFRRIWQAPDHVTALRRYLAVWRTYRHSQPEAVATLRRNFCPTLTHYAIQQAHPKWPLTQLRTKSHLERFHRNLRRHIRSAGAFHSNETALAVIAYEADPFFRSRQALRPMAQP